MIGRLVRLPVLIAIISVSIADSFKDNRTPDFKIFTFTQQWPQAVCLKGQQEKNRTCITMTGLNYWGIHGLWPNKTDCKAVPFDGDKIKSLLPDLQKYWPDLYVEKDPYTFWKHEWRNHGVCALSLYATRDQFHYFSTALNLYKKYDVLGYLRSSGIIPSTKKTFTKDEILSAIRKKVGVTVLLGCITDQKKNKSLLYQIEICMDTSFKLINCTLENESLISVCPERGINYFPVKK